jgi:hypothetical protein
MVLKILRQDAAQVMLVKDDGVIRFFDKWSSQCRTLQVTV